MNLFNVSPSTDDSIDKYIGFREIAKSKVLLMSLRPLDNKRTSMMDGSEDRLVIIPQSNRCGEIVSTIRSTLYCDSTSVECRGTDGFKPNSPLFMLRLYERSTGAVTSGMTLDA